MNTTSLSATAGTVVVVLLVIWGLNWYCVKQQPTGWIGKEMCPAVEPFYNLSGRIARWFAGLFGDDASAASMALSRGTGCGTGSVVPQRESFSIVAVDHRESFRRWRKS